MLSGSQAASNVGDADTGRVEHTTRFLSSTVEQIRNEFSSVDFLHDFSSEVGVTNDGAEVAEDNGATTAEMPWSFPTDRPGIPSLAKKLLPAEVKLDWKQRWEAASEQAADGEIHVALYGSPSATVVGQATLRQDGADVRYLVATTVKTSLRWPVAGTVESMVDKDLVGWILSVQARVLRRRLGLSDD